MAEERDQAGQQEFNQKVVEKINSDPDFLGHLLENPQETLESSGLADAAKGLEEQEGEAEEGQTEVAGHAYHNYVTYYWTCRWIIYPYRYHRR